LVGKPDQPITLLYQNLEDMERCVPHLKRQYIQGLKRGLGEFKTLTQMGVNQWCEL
jgi:hypothetical protein